MSKKITGFSKQVEEIYREYDWPGNVRELENAVEYGVNMAFGDQIGRDAVPARLLREGGAGNRDQGQRSAARGDGQGI